MIGIRSRLLGLVLVLTCFSCVCIPSVAEDNDPLTTLEKKINGRIGVVALDTGSGRQLSHRANERFAMCSTFKLILVAQILHRADSGEEKLDRVIPYGPADLLAYAPITTKHVKEKGMKVSNLCAAAIQTSDNTAANLLLRTQGGPQGLTTYLRSLGDQVTHLDRIEPFLNTPVPGKTLDSTTPEAMVETIRKLLLGTALSAPSRERLTTWLMGNTTGDNRLKAGLPVSWTIAEKTGTADNGATNDVGILTPRTGPPIAIAAFVSDSRGTSAANEAALAEVARIAIKWLGR